jgi:xanthine dehydrogenase YagT iron-sulfur-binding subunit
MGGSKDRNREAVTRRSFLKGVGAGGIGSTLLSASDVAAETIREEDAELGTLIGPGPAPVTLRVNGRDITVRIEPRDTLLDALRQGKTPEGEWVDLTGSKRVCDRASCGACSMIVDGELVYGCTVLAVEAQGAEITTIEGIGAPESMHAVQEAFVEHDALMCGFCTPGMLAAVTVLLEHNPSPTRDEIRKALEGNLCRCGTYPRIFEATEAAAARLREA